MARVKFTRQYDHTFKSGAMKNYPNNWEGTLPRDVERAAVKAGAARRVGKASTKDSPPVGPHGGKLDNAKPESRLPGNLPLDLAVPQALTPNLSTAPDSE